MGKHGLRVSAGHVTQHCQQLREWACRPSQAGRHGLRVPGSSTCSRHHLGSAQQRSTRTGKLCPAAASQPLQQRAAIAQHLSTCEGKQDIQTGWWMCAWPLVHSMCSKQEAASAQQGGAATGAVTVQVATGRAVWQGLAHPPAHMLPLKQLLPCLSRAAWHAEGHMCSRHSSLVSLSYLDSGWMPVSRLAA